MKITMISNMNSLLIMLIISSETPYTKVSSTELKSKPKPEVKCPPPKKKKNH